MNDSDSSSSHSFRLLGKRNFALLWIGAVVSASGFYVGNVVIEWFIYASSHDALYLTILGVIEFVPILSIGIIAGALVDRHDRRHLMIASDLARAATLGALAAYVLILGFNLPVILILMFAIAAFGTVFNPSSGAILPSLLNKDDLPDGNGLLEAGTTAAGFIGSPLGGALILVVGVGGGLIYNSATFAISALMIALITIPVALNRKPEDSESEKGSLLSDVKAGFRFLREQRALLTLTLASMVLNFFTFYLLYVVVFVSNVLHAGPAVFGLVVGVQSAGYAVGALLLVGRLKMGRRPGVWIPVAWGLSGLPLIIMILIPLVPIAMVCAVTMGVLSALVNITFVSTVQKIVPDEFLGRYFAIDQAGGYSMIPAGLVVGGLLIVTVGVGVAFVLAGAGTLVIGLGLLLSSSVRSWGRP
jgi:MFS family permease